MSLTKTLAQRAARRLGYRISRLDRAPPAPARAAGAPPGLTPYKLTLHAMSAVADTLRVVQVGANDGRTGDPLARFLRSRPGRAEVMLFEPQPSLIPHLTENYAYHPAATIVNAAVGPQSDLTLNVVSPDIWDRLDIPYARRAGFPVHRAATGVTSFDRASVVAWVRRHAPKGTDAEAAVDTLRVPCAPLTEHLATHGWPDRIDVLQIDTEGFDDEVIYASDIARTRPAVIFYESKHLARSSPERPARLAAHLAAHGYATVAQGHSDTLAVLKRPRRRLTRS
ncbi:MAG: FkbM family methyltransferase [Paracoccaceae bacterium]